ncbi:MAG: phytoene desaturase family protein [Pseudomonadales bacterium]
MQQYDTIIIGGGHNGLVCAAYLARGGHNVLLLEANESLGGLASTREFHPGFKASVAHTINQFSPRIAADLSLAKHGYAGAGEPLPTVGLGLDGNYVRVHRGIASGVSVDDVQQYGEYNTLLQRCARALQPSWLKTMPHLGNNSLSELLTFAQIGIKLRLLGRKHMREFLRIASLPARDLMDENFDNELLKATLSWDGLIGSRQAPRSPNNTVLTMLYRMIGEHDGVHAIPKGGIESLINALTAAATSAGVVLRTGCVVTNVLVEADETGLQAKGVKLADGSRVEADRVVSATDPKRTFLELVGAQNLEIDFTNRIHRLRSDGFVAKLHLALSDLPEFNGLTDPRGRIILAPDLDTIEFAYDDAKYGKCPQQPVMEVLIPSLSDASFAPAGQHVLSAHVMYIPYRLKGGWTEAAHAALREQLIDTLCQYSPGLRDQILYAELLTPADLEQGWNVSGGHWHHTEFAMDQLLMMRPTYEAAQYATPIPGLYLCSAGCHPGGGLMGGAGHNAAHEILK